jgi:hypothetical protein
MSEASRRWIIALLLGGLPFHACGVAADAFLVSPAAVLLDRPEASQQQLVTLHDGVTWRDVTRQARLTVEPPEIATADDRGVLRPGAEGAGELIVDVGGQRLTVPIVVRGLEQPPPVSFRHDVIPLLTKAGCNSGGCHGKAEGQNGFRLSVFGFDPASDYESIASGSRGRRVSVAAAEESLIFLKGSARMPHGGGEKIKPHSPHDRRLLRWLAEGASDDADAESDRATVAIEVEPERRTMAAGHAQQLRVTAVDAAGRRRCVTVEADYESNAPMIAGVDRHGLVEASDTPGEAAILVRYGGHVAVSRVTLPRPEVVVVRPPENNFIDRLVWDKLCRLGVPPSRLADDSEFMRRAYLDTIGTLPTVEEARTFIDDTATDKREALIDGLLERPEYADYWTMRWLDLLKGDPLTVSPQGVAAMHRWLRQGFVENRPYDQFARELLTAQGNTSAARPTAFYKAVPKPDQAARAISQLLLGVRIECAECHHHPSDRWGQDDYVALAGFFTGVSLKKLPNGEQALVARGGDDLPHPRSGELVPARPLGAPATAFAPNVDRRRALAEWMTASDNPFFATAIVNRLWAHYFGRGLIMPIDDVRETNPASNEPLLQALVEHFRDTGHDLKAFTRTLLRSRVYQLSTATGNGNAADAQNFSRAPYKPLPAEVLLDAICQSTGVGEQFNGWPDGYRAIQVWDNRMPSYFLTIFGRPVRATVCECERSNEPSISQALHLLNAPEIAAKLRHRHGRARVLADSSLSHRDIIDELSLATLSRRPTDAECALMLEAFEVSGNDRQAAVEDILWALLNSKDYIFNR